MSTILFELGCEELPPKSLKPLRDALQASVTEQLTEADITFDSIKAFAAPRRLAIQIQGISDKQPDRSEQKRGPAIKAAFDSDGNPTRAAMGFAKGLGIEASELITINTAHCTGRTNSLRLAPERMRLAIGKLSSAVWNIAGSSSVVA